MDPASRFHLDVQRHLLTASSYIHKDSSEYLWFRPRYVRCKLGLVA